MKRLKKLFPFIEDLLDSSLPENLVYHCKEHTLKYVFNAVDRLAVSESISENDHVLLLVSVLFHDVGYVFKMEEHEKTGIDFARKILPDYGFQPEEIEKIAEIIQSTKVKIVDGLPLQCPGDNIMFQIICDADLDSLGREDYPQRSWALYMENTNLGAVIDLKDWWKGQWIFLNRHEYFTKSNTEFRKEGKRKNLEYVKTKLDELNINISEIKI